MPNGFHPELFPTWLVPRMVDVEELNKYAVRITHIVENRCVYFWSKDPKEYIRADKK